MEKLDRYLILSVWAAALIGWFILISLVASCEIWIFSAPILFVVGVVQLLAGIQISATDKGYPDWLVKGMTKYWVITVGYFVGLYFMYDRFTFDDFAYKFWLFGMPIPIAVYQFSLFNRLKKGRKFKGESEALEKTLKLG